MNERTKSNFKHILEPKKSIFQVTRENKLVFMVIQRHPSGGFNELEGGTVSPEVSSSINHTISDFHTAS